jgi:hypothetical protein
MREGTTDSNRKERSTPEGRSVPSFLGIYIYEGRNDRLTEEGTFLPTLGLYSYKGRNDRLYREGTALPTLELYS